MHIFLKQPALAKCPKCGVSVLLHTVCQNCGFYRGVEYINVLEKLTKKEQKLKEKEIKAKEMEDKIASGKEKPLGWEGLSRGRDGLSK